MTELDGWGVIMNPKAGKRSSDKSLSVKDELVRAGLNGEFVFTERAGHAAELAADFIRKGVRKLLVVGGDGSFSEVVSGVCMNDGGAGDVLLALLPLGTGNDWCRYWKIKKSVSWCADIIKRGKTERIDVGRYEESGADGCVTRYFVNSLGLGFDARTVRYADLVRKKFSGKAWAYYIAVFASFLMNKSVKSKLWINGSLALDDKIYTVSVGNGPFTGGGIKQTPGADPTDGKFEVMVMVNPSWWQRCKALAGLACGRLQACGFVRYFEAQSVAIDTYGLEAERDGIYSDEVKNISVSIEKGRFEMIVP